MAGFKRELRTFIRISSNAEHLYDFVQASTSFMNNHNNKIVCINAEAHQTQIQCEMSIMDLAAIVKRFELLGLKIIDGNEKFNYVVIPAILCPKDPS